MGKRVGFIGLGTMGSHMARHLLQAGHELKVFNRTKEKALPLLGEVADWAPTPAELALSVEFVFICLTDGKAVEDVLLGADGIVSGAHPGLVVVDLSTIAPSEAQRFAGIAHSHQFDMLDAPVTGGDVGARDATLAIMVGGSENSYHRVEPILRVMGKTVRHVGPSGSGLRLKLCNQIMCAGHMLTLCEMLVFAERTGVDLKMALEIISQGAGDSWALRQLGPKIVTGELSTGFAIELMIKDLKLVIAEAKSGKFFMHITESVMEMFEHARGLADTRLATQGMILVSRDFADKSADC